MKTFSFFALTLIVATTHAQLGAKTEQNKIQGTWHNSESGRLILNADGSGEFDGEKIKYTAKDNKFTLTIIEEGQTLVYTYNLNGNSLTISGGDLEEPVTFTRKGSN